MTANNASASVPDEADHSNKSFYSGTRGFTSILFGTFAAIGLFALLSGSSTDGPGKLVLTVTTLALVALAARGYWVGLIAAQRGLIVRKYLHTELIQWKDIASFVVINNGYYIGYVTHERRTRKLMFFATLGERTAESVVQQLRTLQVRHLSESG